jgi:uncharacterized BrkB/YihY/UPF0761 family membrane protein
LVRRRDDHQQHRVIERCSAGNVLSIVREQAARIAGNSGGALSLGIILGILVSLWSAMSGVKAMIDAAR